SSSGSSTVSIPASAEVGSLSITQPLTTSTSYFKIASNNLLTFGWNFTSVLVTPTSLTVSAACENSNTYPVGDNSGVVAGDATQVVWDVYSYQTAHSDNPLPQGTCSLMICDERGYDATQAAGYMAVNSDLTFALYTPQAYTGIADGWECGVCNSSLAGIAANPTVVTMAATFLVVCLSGYQLLRS
ncbi:hypothetical protein CPB85DRAFT_1186950, partial [Mucidula mucida]